MVQASGGSSLDSEINVMDRFVGALAAGLGDRLVGVVLFGSRARGDHRPDSDWDVLVIAEGLPEHPLERHRRLVDALRPRFAGLVSLLAKTPEEFEAYLSAIYLDIALDGKILFDPRGYAADKLSRLRGIIERKGLDRERTPAGDRWRWRKPPPRHWSIEWVD